MTALRKRKGCASPKDAVIGRTLRQVRRGRNLSQDALASKMGITFQQIQKYESGANRISASRLHDLAEILEVDIRTFFADLESQGHRAAGTKALPVPPSRDIVTLITSYEPLSQEKKQAIRRLLKVMGN